MEKVITKDGVFAVDQNSIYQRDGGNLEVSKINGRWWFRRADGGGLNSYDHPDNQLTNFIRKLKRKSREIGKKQGG